MSNLVLYKMNASPPACAVRALGDKLGLNFECRDVDFVNMEHKSAEYMKLNPMGTIPMLKDGDFVISESNATMKYLLEKYGGDARELLYPSGARERALIDEAMFFNTGVFFIRLKVVALPTIFGGLDGPTPKHIEDIETAYGVVEAYLKRGKYVAGERLTLADLAVGTTAAAMQAIHKLDAERFPRTVEWLALLHEDPSFKKYAEPGADILNKVLNTFWEKNKKQ